MGNEITAGTAPGGILGNVLGYVQRGADIYGGIMGTRGQNATSQPVVAETAAVKARPNWLMYGAIALGVIVIGFLAFRGKGGK